MSSNTLMPLPACRCLHCRYTKIVQKGMDRAELILKVVMTPHDMAHAFVANFINLMKGDAEVSSFQRVLEMKVGEARCVHCTRECWVCSWNGYIFAVDSI